ncbi:MAG TPA: hypothetical protein VGG68_15700 [Caulobacteraceae bacterium]|jgi:acetyl-CoA carboxylase beta subunit
MERLIDADSRRFFDEFESVRVSRFRAAGVIDPAKRHAVIPFPGGKQKLIGVAHTKLKYGGGWSYFICPKCAKMAQTLYLVENAARCAKCCAAFNVRHRSQYGLGRYARRQATDQALDRLVAKLETKEPLRLRTPRTWYGKAKLVARSHTLTNSMRRAMIRLRLNQLASNLTLTKDATVKSFGPRSDAIAVIPELQQIWKTQSCERLEQALDQAQITILNALDSNDPQLRLAAAKLMLNTKQARERGLQT